MAKAGRSSGVRRLGVSANFAVGITGLLLARLANAAPSITITAPTLNKQVSNGMSVSVNVTSGALVTGVTASIGAQSKALTFQSGTTYTGSLDTTTLPWGTQTLTVTATDNSPSQNTATVSVLHDEHPKRVIDEMPLSAYLAPQPYRFRFRCVDDNPAGCVSFVFTVRDKTTSTTTTLASATTSIDQMVDLAPYEGHVVEFSLVYTDTGGHTNPVTTLPRQSALITKNPPLCLYAAPFPVNGDYSAQEGISDADDDRILSTFYLYDRHTGTKTTFPQQTLAGKLLIPGGALLVPTSGTGYTKFLPNGFVPGGAQTRLLSTGFSVFGNYVLPYGGSPAKQFDTSVASATASSGGPTGASYGFGSVDTTTGEQCTVSTTKPNVIEMVPVVGTKRSITVDASFSVYECFADNGNVVYRYTSPSIPGQHVGLAMIDKNGTPTTLILETTVVGTGSLYNVPAKPLIGGSRWYGVVGDWVYFWKGDQFWRRSPAGVIEAVSNPITGGNNQSKFFGMTPDGEMLLVGSPDGSTVNYGLHRVPVGQSMSAATYVPGPPFFLFGDTIGVEGGPVWRNNRWIFADDSVNSRRSLYVFNDGPNKPYECAPAVAPPVTDAGVADSGSVVDSGTIADAGVAEDASIDASLADAAVDDGGEILGTDGAVATTEDAGMPNGGSNDGFADSGSGGGGSPGDASDDDDSGGGGDDDGGCNQSNGARGGSFAGVAMLLALAAIRRRRNV